MWNNCSTHNSLHLAQPTNHTLLLPFATGSHTPGSIVRQTIVVLVTVGLKTTHHPNHPNHDQTSSQTSSQYTYYMDGRETSNFYLQRGMTYHFQMAPATHAAYPLVLYVNDVLMLPVVGCWLLVVGCWLLVLYTRVLYLPV
jgi:hypothetical protein